MGDSSFGHRAQRASGRNGTEAPPEAESHETAVPVDRTRWNQRLGTPPEDQHACVDGGRRIERRPRQPPAQADLVERAPDHPVERAWPWNRPFDRHSPLHDKVGANKRRQRIVEEQVQQVGRPIEWQIGDDAKRLARQLKVRRIALDHLNVPPASAETGCPFRIQLDGEDTVSRARELCGKPPAARPEFDHEIVDADARAADQLRRQSLIAEKVLATSR